MKCFLCIKVCWILFFVRFEEVLKFFEIQNASAMTPNQFFEFLNVHINKLHKIQTTGLNLSVKQYFHSI